MVHVCPEMTFGQIILSDRKEAFTSQINCHKVKQHGTRLGDYIESILYISRRIQDYEKW